MKKWRGRVRVNATEATYQIGTLRSEVGDGIKTVAEKVNSRSFNLHRDYSKSLTLSNVGEPPKVESLCTISNFRKREEISSSLVYFPCET